MSRQRNIDGDARAALNYLIKHRDRRFRFGELATEVGIPTSKRGKAAIRRAAVMAEAMGLFLTVPAPGNGWTITLTEIRMEAAYSRKFLLAVVGGIRQSIDRCEDFITHDDGALGQDQRAIRSAIVSQQKVLRAQLEALEDLYQAFIETL